MKNKINLFILSGFVVFTSCTTDSISDLTEPTNLNEVTYTSAVKSIIDSNCIVCHGDIPTNGAPMSLTTYENVKEAVLNRNLLDRISRTEGTSGAMPLGGPRLPQNDINAITSWIDDNFPQ